MNLLDSILQEWAFCLVSVVHPSAFCVRLSTLRASNAKRRSLLGLPTEDEPPALENAGG